MSEIRQREIPSRENSPSTISKLSKDRSIAKKIMKNNLAKVETALAKGGYKEMVGKKYAKRRVPSESVSATSQFV